MLASKRTVLASRSLDIEVALERAQRDPYYVISRRIPKERNVNFGRILLAGVVAGILYFLGDGLVHGVLLKQQWAIILSAINIDPERAMNSPAIYGMYDLAKGLAVMWVYAAIRPRFGAGPKSAFLAGLAVWFLTVPVPLLGLLPMKFFGPDFVAQWAAYDIVPMLLGALVGGWLYRES